MKKGDKAWVLCEVAGDSPCGALLMKGPQGTPFWANERDCKPVEPETAEELKELDSDYRDATPEDVLLVMQGEKVRAKFKEHDNSWADGYYHGFLGGWANYDEARRYLDDDGCPWKYCQVYDPKKPEAESDDDSFYEPWEIDVNEPSKYDPPKTGLDLLSDFDIVEAGDLFQSSRDGKFHRCNFTMGMPVRDAVLRGCQQRETWTFYRPKVQA